MKMKIWIIKTKMMIKNKTLFTTLSLLTPMLAFGASGANGNVMLYSMASIGAVVILFALYALMRSAAAGNNQMQTATVSSGRSSHQASSFASDTGNDAVVRSTSASGDGFSGLHSSGGNDIFDDERDLLMDHEYDGIQELNNKLPPWWVGLFYITIAIAVWYFPYYHMYSGWSSDKEYNEEMAAAAVEIKAYQDANGGAITEETVELLKDEAALAAGKELFVKNCVACHLADGGGLVGPNLTDKFWLHGGGIKNVFKTIKYGVPDKGMVAWKASMTPTQIQQVSSYILVSLQGTTPATPKAAEGEEYTE